MAGPDIFVRGRDVGPSPTDKYYPDNFFFIPPLI